MGERITMLFKHKKLIFAIFFSFILIISSFLLVNEVFAQDFGTSYLAGTDLPTEDLRIVVVNIIRIALGVLGVIFLGFIIYAGVVWATAAGNATRIQRAQKIIINAVIGLIIIFLAFAIVTFVFNILNDSQSGPGGGPGSCTDGQVAGCSRCIAGSWRYDPALCPLPGSEFW